MQQIKMQWIIALCLIAISASCFAEENSRNIVIDSDEVSAVSIKQFNWYVAHTGSVRPDRELLYDLKIADRALTNLWILRTFSGEKLVFTKKNVPLFNEDEIFTEILLDQGNKKTKLVSNGCHLRIVGTSYIKKLTQDERLSLAMWRVTESSRETDSMFFDWCNQL